MFCVAVSFGCFSGTGRVEIGLFYWILGRAGNSKSLAAKLVLHQQYRTATSFSFVDGRVSIGFHSHGTLFRLVFYLSLNIEFLIRDRPSLLRWLETTYSNPIDNC